MGVVRLVPVLLLAAGVGCFVVAVATGAAATGVFVIFPFIIGSGPLAFLAALLVAAGLLTLPWAFTPAPEIGPSRPPPVEQRPSSSWGGVALVGPVPIFFGSWRGPSRWIYWTAVVAGLVLLLLVFLWAAVLLR